MSKTASVDKVRKRRPAEGERKPSLHDLAKDLIFKDAESPPDLSTNPKHFDDFGLDRAQRSAKR
jgi:hypothetical protein